MSLEEKTEQAQFMVGKTVETVAVIGCENENDCDGENVLLLAFTDGTKAKVVGGYGDYTGKSCDEYKEFIWIKPFKESSQ